MIAHVILFKPRPGLTPSEWGAIVGAMKDVASTIESIRHFRVGRRVRHGLVGYEQAMREDYEYAAVIEFSDLEGLTAYLRHPAHRAIGAHFAASSSASLAYDYELVDVREAALLLQDKASSDAPKNC